MVEENMTQLDEFVKYQQDLLKNYQYLNKIATKGQVLFTGSSLMEQFPIVELAMIYGLNIKVHNRGVGGFTTSQFLENIETMALDLEPTTLFINIGTNDIQDQAGQLSWQVTLENNYREILRQIKAALPTTKVYVMAYYPMDETHPILKYWQGFSRTNVKIAEANQIAENLAHEFGYHFINVNAGLADETGNLYRHFTKDGIHLYAEAYVVVYRNLLPYLQRSL